MKIRDQFDFEQRGIIYDERDVNKLIRFQGESLKHFMIKACLFWKLRKLKHDIVTEFIVQGCGVGDVLDLYSHTHYEIEINTRPYRMKLKAEQYARKGVEVIVIDCRKAPNDLKEISKFLDDYVVPD